MAVFTIERADYDSTKPSMTPDISISIPVRNGAMTLPTALSAISSSAAELEYEVIVIDGGSSDGSLDIARDFGCVVIPGDYKLMAARRLGVELSSAPAVVLLDADQILREGSLAEAAKALQDGVDMVALGERVWQPKTAFQRWSDADKELIEMNVAAQTDPMRGVILPRVFNRQILLEALDAIPASNDPLVLGLDHAIIYLEVSRITNRIGYVPSAIFHCEPSSIFEVWKKNYRWGKSIAALNSQGSYSDLVSAKNRRRWSSSGPLLLKARSMLFLATKAPAYFGGQIIGKRQRPISEYFVKKREK